MTRNATVNSAGPQTVVDDFTNAWNTHDMAAYDRLFTDAAVWIPVAESRVTGRAAIVQDFKDIHESWAAKTTVVSSDVEVHAVRPDVSVLLFHSGFLDELGNAIPGVDRAVILMVVQGTGGWKIAAGQVTKQSN
ncbi:MAG: SgcJ/EcaC family oxidoreductase [Chloroflexi bacterium]|nr:SgcJ/EcaC family oxidoreductase [Chloroflexota bacterium]